MLRIALLALVATAAFGVRRPQAHVVVPPSVAAGFSRPAEVSRVALIIPVEGIVASQLKQTFNEGRVGHVHHALDILAPRGTPVLAAVDGTIRKLFFSGAGGITVYQFDMDGSLVYYYAHLDRYAGDLREGMTVRQGDVIGYVGTTGNAPASTPHLHFAIGRLGADKKWWDSEAIDPYPLLTTPASALPTIASRPD
jgi:murein DD-endopeptidase MepM/ murein hydrolase activator NlpD